MPLVRTDFALGMRRNVRGAAWLKDAFLAPARMPDLPFGNCWSSGIAANLHVIERGPDRPVFVLVTDEQGTLHRFVTLFGEEGRPFYYPLPSAEHEQESAVMRLTRTAGGGWVFRRKYGATLLYANEPAITLGAASDPAHRDDLAGERHVYHRLVSVEDAKGSKIEHHFGSGNTGLIPDEIVFKSRRICIERDEAGCARRIVDPLGRDFLFFYRPASLPEGAPLLERIERPSIGGRRYTITYNYDEAVETRLDRPAEVAAFHANISGITNADGHSYHFEWGFDRSRLEIDGEGVRPAAGMPRCITRSIQPDEIGAAAFVNHSEIFPDAERASRRITFVCDAAGNGRIYHFRDPEVVSLSSLPFQQHANPEKARQHAPRVAIFRSLQLTHCQGKRHRLLSTRQEVRPSWPAKALACETYEFDLGAGMALAKAVDLSGNVTKFQYGDPLVSLLPGIENPLAQRHGDPTGRINASGGVRRFRYDAGGRWRIEREDELGRIERFTVNSQRGVRLAEATFASREACNRNEPFTLTEFSYDDERFPGFITQKVVRKLPRPQPGPEWEQDLVTVFEPDELGEIAVEIKDPDGLRIVTRFAYDLGSNKLSVRHPSGYFTQFRYDELNRLIRVYRPGRAAKRIYFDGRGNKIREIESDGTVTVFEYDGVNRLLRSFSGPNAKEIRSKLPFRYNPVGSRIFCPDVTNDSQTRTYDALQRLVTTKTSSGAVVRYTYGRNCGSLLFDWCTFKSTTAHANGCHPTHWKYDFACRQLEECVVGAMPRFSQYDAVGNLIVEVDSQEQWTRHEYDVLNRRVRTILPNGRVRQTFYTSTGLEFATIDEHGTRVEHRYDGAGELIEEDEK